MRWLCVLASGCLVVGEPGEDASEAILPLGEVHPCTLDVEAYGTARWTICFANASHIRRFTREMVESCEANGTTCDVRCSSVSLHPCVLACPGTGIPRGCNASHGCYCPDPE